MVVDVVIIGGGPAGLSAALVLGRSRKRVVVFDAGSPRNARASHVHGFVTRDGIPPRELREAAHAELAAYDTVDRRDGQVTKIEPVSIFGGDPMRDGRYTVFAGGEMLRARRILLCVGIVDEVPAMPGYRELWGTCVFQCPYCHAFEARDRRFGYVPRDANAETSFALLLRGWTKDLIVFTGGTCELGRDHRRELEHAGITIDDRPMRGLRIADGRLAAIELVDGGEVERDVLFVHPPQCQTELVKSLKLDCKDADVHVDDHYETSRPGIHAAGDLTTPLDSAIFAASAGAAAAYKINALLTKELLAAGLL
ncbi:MAG TPA: NAD(P)/FAD-dependent oxidoreductase [Kofleriaceae bacterium]|nr:NAD(P)/FAD-dependent oxidoreductase [Kofleriaceae bacterium]